LAVEICELFYAVLLDNKHRKLRDVLVSKGSLTSALVHPRDVFAQVVRHSAAAIVVVHNLCVAAHNPCYVMRGFMCSAPREVVKSDGLAIVIGVGAPHNAGCTGLISVRVHTVPARRAREQLR
jgi:light-regulated signal transduction histidine kinase (bacteriophytochrome)